MDVFVIWAWEKWFFRGNRKKKSSPIPIYFFGRWDIVGFTELTFLWTKYGRESKMFFIKIWKKWHESTSFLREWTLCPIDFMAKYIGITAAGSLWKIWKKMTWDNRVSENWRFCTKKGLESSVFLENGLFLTKYWHDSNVFFVNIGKKGHSVNFYGPYILVW